MKKTRITIGDVSPLDLYGSGNANLRFLQEAVRAKIVARGDEIVVEGEDGDVDLVRRILEDMLALSCGGRALEVTDYSIALERHRGTRGDEPPETTSSDDLEIVGLKRRIYPKSLGQRDYMRAVRETDIVFAIGPAGTGKTYLAMACAADALKRREVERLMLVRPAVEAGERLGFLPGDFQEKVDPYLRPLYDALRDMMPPDKIKRCMDTGVIEVAPLAYMRGRSLNNAFVILDEAQNTTLDQMKMFLTRLGYDSKAVITGDVTQIDLERKSDSGLVRVQRVLDSIAGIRFVYLTDADVVRHPLVQNIIRAFEAYETMENKIRRTRAANSPQGTGVSDE